jgi:hypothetical protein
MVSQTITGYTTCWKLAISGIAVRAHNKGISAMFQRRLLLLALGLPFLYNLRVCLHCKGGYIYVSVI